MEPPLVQHLESYLGQIVEGWTKDIHGRNSPFQVVRLAGKGAADPQYFSTLGLSDYVFKSRITGSAIRCELMMIAKNGTGAIPGILQQVGQEAMRSGLAILRGDLIGPRDCLVAGSSLVALYASIPVYIVHEFASCKLGANETAIFIWLIPISAEEAAFVKSTGWEQFESLLEREDPDLTDFFRSSIVATYRARP